jgi:hypothetical protein
MLTKLKFLTRIYKRNVCCLYMRPTIWFASTGNNKMEDTEQLTAKVEQVTITEQPAEQKVETTEQKGEVKA